MAATESDNATEPLVDQPSPAQTIFQGAAQALYSSFAELAKMSLDNLCRGWKDQVEPRSHMIPPVFYVKNPEVLAQVAEDALDVPPPAASVEFDRLAIDHESDLAEQTVFDALSSLADERSIAPFLVLRGVNLNRNRLHLTKIFPDLEWTSLRRSLESRFNRHLPSKWMPDTAAFKTTFSSCLSGILSAANGDEGKFEVEVRKYFGENFTTVLTLGLEKENAIRDLKLCFNDHFKEFDYVIIGPRVGIVVIEVKGSAFRQRKHFNTDKNLPEQFRDGLYQLRSFDYVLHFLNEVTGKHVPPNQVRRVLFMPNLRKSRLDEWLTRPRLWMRPPDERTGNSRRLRVKSSLEEAHCWFQEDTVNSASVTEDITLRKPLLFDKLRDFLCCVDDAHQLRLDIYESFASILAGLSSVIIKNETISLEDMKLLQSRAIQQESNIVETHDHLRTLDRSMDRTKSHKRREKVWMQGRKQVQVWKAMILSPEQLGVSSGPTHQVIVAPAGCGKTILLEAKALELVRARESVLVICAECYIERFELLFQKHGLHDHTQSVMSWSKIAPELRRTGNILLRLKHFKNVSDIADILDTPVGQKMAMEFRALIRGHKHVLIDDGLEDPVWVEHADKLYSLSLWIIVLALKHNSILNTVWIALDPYVFRRNVSGEFMRPLEELFDLARSANSTVAYLQQVMRYPESVHRRLNTLIPTTAEAPGPAIGHHIQGLQRTRHVDTKEKLLDEVRGLVDEARREIPLEQIVIVLGGTGSSLSDLKALLTVNLGEQDHFREVAIYFWHEVASLEWSFIIYIEREKLTQNTALNQIRYRACTRATGMLVDIYCTFSF